MSITWLAIVRPGRLLTRVRQARQDGERGYVAILAALVMLLLVALSGFALDVGNWYVQGQQAQRAADAAALAGVTALPGDRATAFTNAQRYSSMNGFGASSTVTVVPAVDGAPTRLRVTVSKKVSNTFGALLGVPTTWVGRTAVADYNGPVPMGSPCNGFGNDPDPGTRRGTACSGVSGQLWANVNSRSSDKGNGDAYQSYTCPSADGCAGGVNTEYATDGYFYTVSVKRAMASLTIELFDPSFTNVDLSCASNLANAPSARNDWVTDEPTRYASGASSAYCTGDAIYSGSTAMSTEFTVRSPSNSAWDPLTFPVYSPSCQKTYPGYNLNSTNLGNALNKTSAGYNDGLAQTFRRWSTLCTIPNPAIGDYLIQVKTNGIGPAGANAGNRFAMRAYGASATENNAISVSGREKMGIYSNKPGATTEFYLARVPSGAAGQILNVRLFDVGDSNQAGSIKISPPPDTGISSFVGCRGSGPISTTLTNCTLASVTTGTHNGKWQQVSVPIPTTYTCNDADNTSCWVRLTYLYGTGSAPTDVTTWTANIQGDPVRLVE